MQPTYLYAISPAGQVACFCPQICFCSWNCFARVCFACKVVPAVIGGAAWRVYLTAAVGGFYRTTAVPVAIAASMALSAPAVK